MKLNLMIGKNRQGSKLVINCLKIIVFLVIFKASKF